MTKEVIHKYLEAIQFHQKHYFDTCSINWLVDSLSVGDCIATRKLIKEREKQWILSPLNLYEIFAIGDPIRREQIIYKLSNLFPNPGIFFDNPTRILFGEVLGYFFEGLTEFEESLKETWFDVINEPKKTFNVDYQDFKKRRKILEMFTKALKYVLKNNTWEATEDDVDKYTFSVLGHLGIFAPSEEYVKNNNEGEFYAKKLIVFAIFCFGMEPDLTFIDTFWKNQNLSDDDAKLPLIRLAFLYSNYEEKIENSTQLNLMLEFIVSEHKNKGIGRGTISDALHLVYSFYCLYFYTDDKGILSFAQTNPFLDIRVYSVEKNFSFQKEYYLGNNPFYKFVSWLKRKMKRFGFLSN